MRILGHLPTNYLTLCWPLSFIIVMSPAQQFKTTRLPIVYSYIFKVFDVIIEGFWALAIEAELEREAWSENNGATHPVEVRHYDVITRNPSMQYGYKRITFMLGLAIALLCLGNLRATCRWALWPGSILSIDILLRYCAYIGWLTLPRTPVGDILKKVLEGPYARSLMWVKGLRQFKVHQSVEREPFREGLLDPSSPGLAEQLWFYLKYIFPGSRTS